MSSFSKQGNIFRVAIYLTILEIQFISRCFCTWESRWFWRSQAESNLKVEVGRQPLCCIHRGCFGSFLSSVTVPTFFLLCGLLAVSMQLVSLPFFLVFGIFIWVGFHLCTCCLDSRKVLDHSDHLVEDYKDVLPRGNLVIFSQFSMVFMFQD